MFGRDKEQKKEDAKVDGYAIGLNGTLDEFKAANNAAREKTDKVGYHIGASEQRALLDGAAKAFMDGKPEKVQAVLADPGPFNIIGKYNDSKDISGPYMLVKLMDGGYDLAEIITLAYAKVPENKKQAALDKALIDTVRLYENGETLIEGLLRAGANANCTSPDSKFKGVALARAIEGKRSPETVQILFDNGASFDDAKFLMEANSWDDETIDRLKAYREKAEGMPASSAGIGNDEDLRAIILEMREEIKTLTKKLDKFMAATPEKPAAAPAKRHPPTRRPTVI